MQQTAESQLIKSLAAIAQLLAGSRGDPRGSDFNEQIMLIVGEHASAPDASQMIGLARANRRHVVHFGFSHEHPDVPMVSLAFLKGGTVTFYERCLIWCADDLEPVRLVPDSFAAGFYQFDRDMRLKHHRNAPATDGPAGQDGIVRACLRLMSIMDADPAQATDPAPIPLHAS